MGEKNKSPCCTSCLKHVGCAREKYPVVEGKNESLLRDCADWCALSGCVREKKHKAAAGKNKPQDLEGCAPRVLCRKTETAAGWCGKKENPCGRLRPLAEVKYEKPPSRCARAGAGKKKPVRKKGNREAALSDSNSYRQTWPVARELCHELDQGEKKSRRERVVQIGVSEERNSL